MDKLESTFAWCRTDENAVRLAALFADNLTPSYISHAELQGPRALNPTTWSPDIWEVLRTDILSRVAQPLDADAGTRTKLAISGTMSGAIVAVFLVTFNREAPHPYVEIEDMMIAPEARSQGVGQAFMDWITSEAKMRGIRRLFLESGVTNNSAHHFFERNGFKQTSIVMMKDLG